MKITRLLPFAAAALLGLAGCSKSDDSSAGMSKFEVRLTDAPGDYKAVNLDVQQVQVHVSDDDKEEGWQNLGLIRPGIYNVMDYTNGNSALLTSADFPAGKISQIRLILGNNNTLTLRDGTVVPLKTPSGQTSGLKLKIDAVLVRDVTYQLVLDFDVAKSIVAKGNGGYNLKPVIRTVTTAVAGGIRGVVTPAAARPLVLAIRTSAAPNDTLSTTADAAGGFLIRAVPAGTYRVEFQTVLPYRNATRTGVSVTNDQITDLGSVSVQ
ncbi:DUF4382 domain-containing protein [Hymenobacter convexus]|uniref:DUF4382 domain-containing protein n=1 Tax=Hymenobacter sp. CA1UV-4 TaxID=3063782 RepID=UPI002713AA42|nr:DUF4382 domain-containing protein [Hymenobacter sp. CA1UV-4]MDO7850832.1 DUF4382 domain-containing protein [Hymenobacter sp. CA1UV-4]